VWAQALVSGADQSRLRQKVHRYCGYIKKCDDPAENIGEPICGQWLDGPYQK
jgi:hypothetical protein